MKILIVTRNLPPLIGGMERLNWHIADELSKTHDVTLLSFTDAKKTAPPNCIFLGISLSPLPLFLIFAFVRTFFICLTLKPDILFAGSGLTAPIVVFWAKIFRKKSMIYIHGLDIATDHPAYNFIWVPAIKKADKIIANSSPTYAICIQKDISQQKLEIIHPGVNFPPVEKNQQLITALKTQYQLDNKKVLISVGRLTERKAMREFVDNSLPAIVKACPNTILVIIGDTPSQSLNKNLQSKESIIAVAEKHNIQKHLLFVGNIADDQLLSAWYYLADLHVFPVKYIPSDPEGFGMVAIEAAAHGLPTVAFATGGIVDAIRQNESGWLVEKNNYDALTKQVINTLRLSTNIKQCQSFAKQFEWKNFGEKIKIQL
jgi:phosphatidylinositol alpha-1,6-mannosyltransferase